ncbi:hypothetical protein RJ639_027965 [Escallonia herrerae]|uniref:Cytochrome P450 n=1 Tax=Escallonia herrerae TaxID=1293975 RepID=A0AA88X3K1_9ASTE|nr:hypothetical protein RJ639_027965 [Escallonia herrerae]
MGTSESAYNLGIGEVDGRQLFSANREVAVGLVLESHGHEHTLPSPLAPLSSYLQTLHKPIPKNLPPGPRPWPIIGNILQIGRKPHISITHFANLHGPLISLKLGSQLLVVGSSPAAATEILKTHDRQLSARYTPKVTIPSLRPLSLVWAGKCNEHWKCLRSLCRTELFSVKAIELQAGLRERKVGEMVDFVGSKEKEGKGVKIGEDFIELKDEGVAGGLKGVIWKMMELGNTPNVADFCPVFDGFDVQGLRKKAMEYQEEVYRTWEVIIKERKEGEGVDASRQHDFLDVMLSCQFSDMQIKFPGSEYFDHDINELFMAGTDTSTSTIEWAISELVKNKEAMEKLREELGKEIDAESINESHMSQLPYLHPCVKETLRLHPPVPFLLPHRAIDTCEVMSYTIPQNTQEDPLSFKPERFLDSKLDFRGQDFELLPFGAGRRMCPELPLGIKQVHLILASLWLLPNNEDPMCLDMNEKFGITLQKEQPLLLIPKQDHPANAVVSKQYCRYRYECNTTKSRREQPFFPLVVLSLISFIFIERLSSQRPPLPPGPYAWPIVGNLFQVGKVLLHVRLATLAKVHGPLMSIRLGRRLLVVASSPAAAAAFLKTHDRTLSGRYVSHPLRVKGSKLHSLALALYDESDDGWRSVRAIYRRELFSAKAIESQVELREKKVRDVMHFLISKEGETIKIREIVHTAAFNMLSNMLFSMDFEDFEGKGVGEGMRQYQTKYIQTAAVPQLSDLFPLLGTWDYQGMYSKLMPIFYQICAAWSDIVKERRKTNMDVSRRRDFLDALIEKGFTDEQINPLLQELTFETKALLVHNFYTSPWRTNRHSSTFGLKIMILLMRELFAAGTESTSATVEWTIVELIRNSEATHRLRDELAKVIKGDKVRESDLSSLPYLEACIKETLRLHPPGPLLLPHRAVQTCEVMGYTIPKDSEVLVNFWAIARDATVWNDPLSYKPERFLTSGLDYSGQNFEYIPFSSGRKICAGQPMASRSISLIVATLVHTFDWLLPSNKEPAHIDMNDSYDLAMHKEKPLSVILKLRKAVAAAPTVV